MTLFGYTLIKASRLEAIQVSRGELNEIRSCVRPVLKARLVLGARNRYRAELYMPSDDKPMMVSAVNRSFKSADDAKQWLRGWFRIEGMIEVTESAARAKSK